MAGMSKDKVQKFLDIVAKQYETFGAEKKIKAINTLEQIPVTWENFLVISDIEDVDLTPAMDNKEQQRYADTQSALEDFVSQHEGQDVNLDDFAQWLGADNTDMHKLMDKAHVYKRLGIKGRPETVAYWDAA